jgi:hypothetical protein
MIMSLPKTSFLALCNAVSVLLRLTLIAGDKSKKCLQRGIVYAMNDLQQAMHKEDVICDQGETKKNKLPLSLLHHFHSNHHLRTSLPRTRRIGEAAGEEHSQGELVQDCDIGDGDVVEVIAARSSVASNQSAMEGSPLVPHQPPIPKLTRRQGIRSPRLSARLHRPPAKATRASKVATRRGLPGAT